MSKLGILSKTTIVLTLIKGIFVLSLIISMLFWSMPILSFNSEIWSIFQERSGVILNPEDVKTYNDLVVDFFRFGSKLGFLNEQELSHMENVRSVITIVNVLFVFSFVTLIVEFSYLSKSQKKFLLEAVRKTSIFIFIITLILSILALVNFQSTFFLFHKIVFIKNFVFPAGSLLKIFYPDEFFQGLSALYLLSVLIVSLIAVAVSHRLKLK